MRTILPLLLAALLAGSARAGSPAEEEAAKYRADLAEGVALLHSGVRDEIHRAIAKFKAALKIRPESAEAYYWLALAYSDLNNYLRAADNAKEAATYDDRLSEAWLLWGQVLLYQKEWEGALDKLETASRLAPDDPLTLFNLGRVYYHGFKNPDSALAKFRSAWQYSQAARRDNPEMTTLALRSRLYMGYCEYERGRKSGNIVNFDNAVNAFQDVLREQPGNLDARFRLALSLRRVNRAGEAEMLLVELLRSFEQSSSPDVVMQAEINLQLADLYLKDPLVKNRMLAITHLMEFVNLTGDSSHPALEAAKEYLSLSGTPISEFQRQ